MALEADEAIFHVLLKSLIRSSVAPEVTSGATATSEDPEGDVLGPENCEEVSIQ